MKMIAGLLVVLGLLLGLYGARKLAKAEAGVEISDVDQKVPLQDSIALSSSEATAFAGAGAVMVLAGGLLLVFATSAQRKAKRARKVQST